MSERNFHDEKLLKEARRKFWPAMNVLYRKLETLEGEDLEIAVRQIRVLCAEGKGPPPAGSAALDLPMAHA